MARRRACSTRAQAPWYANGLRFTCTRCGGCCGGGPGYVWLGADEIERIARYLKLPVEEFLQSYCRRVFKRVSLRETANYDCVFFTPAGCRIYSVRPAQCSSFPFWPDNIDSPESWEDTKTRCPGAGQGRLYQRAEIETIRDRLRTTRGAEGSGTASC